VPGLVIVWALGAYLHHSGYYTAWGLTRATSKNFGTLAILLGFAVPYWLVKWWVKPKRRPRPLRGVSLMKVLGPILILLLLAPWALGFLYVVVMIFLELCHHRFPSSVAVYC
jgi:uncharacterized membrane protein YphA (DoxX/SURF4 family)